MAQLNETDQAIGLMEEVIKQNERILGFAENEKIKKSLEESYIFIAQLWEKKVKRKRFKYI